MPADIPIDRMSTWFPGHVCRIVAGKALKPGDAGPRVAALARRLQATGLMDATDSPVTEFDATVETAVAAFQRHIGLDADGVVGAVTLRELNRTPGERVDQIRANLERWRWLPEDLGNRHIRVNIADYQRDAAVVSALDRAAGAGTR